MTAQLPQPPILADADLRHFPCISINVNDVRSSDMAIEGDPAGNWFCLLLLLASWHQVPAGSLPSDDAKLAYLVGLGRDLRTWKKHKLGALRGWVLCSDGRLYHPMMVEIVEEALQKSRQQRTKVEKRWKSDAPTFAQPIENIETQKYHGNTAAIPGTERNREDKRVSSLRSDTPPIIPPQLPGLEPEGGAPLGEPKAAEPPKPEPLPKPKSAPRGSRLPADWTLPPEWREDALALGLAWNRIDRIADEFRDFWLGVAGSKGVKLDWRATWRNRVRAVVERSGGAGVTLNGSHNRGQTTSDLAAEIRRDYGGDPRFRDGEPPPITGHDGPTIDADTWEKVP